MKTALLKNGLLALLGGVMTFSSCKKDHHYSMTNQDFVTKASSGNMFEVAAGNLAQQNSTNADVKAFGTRMVSDHGKAGTDLATLASKKGWTIPTSLLASDQANLDTLTSLNGTSFDKKFAAIMVNSHIKTIDLFQMASSDSGVPDADLRSFAAGKLPTLREHLQLAQQLQTEVGK